MLNTKTIPIFLAVDENYLPFLAVTIQSIKEHASKTRVYQIHALNSGIAEEKCKPILDMQTGNIKISFENIADKAEQIRSVVHCRDYYTNAIYFRLFIPELFPQYEKAIYLDCDIVLLDDIANLYDINIAENYIGAVADQAVSAVPAFCEYTKNALGIEPNNYFNSGVIVLNLTELRAIDFYKTFYGILSSYNFTVAPDQDCLNLICKDKVHYYGAEWNKMPIDKKVGHPPKLVHYNLVMKPWHYDGIRYEEHFWAFAKQTPYYESIVAQKNAFTGDMATRDTISGERLILLAKAEADSENNYLRTVAKVHQK